MSDPNATISPDDLARLKQLVDEINALIERLHERHEGSYDFMCHARFREFEPPRVGVTIRRIFAEFGR